MPSKVDPLKGDTSDDESYCCSDRMPSDSESDAVQCTQHDFLGAGRLGTCASHNKDNSQPLTSPPGCALRALACMTLIAHMTAVMRRYTVKEANLALRMATYREGDM